MPKTLFLLICVIYSFHLTAQNTQQNKSDKTKYFYASIRPGISQDHMRIKGYFQDQTKFNNPAFPCIIGAFDVDYDGEFIFRLELTYKSFNFHSEGRKGIKTFSPYELKGFSIIPEFQFLHKWSLNSNLHIYGGAGFGWRLSNIKKNEIIFNGQLPIGAPKSLQVESSDAVVSCATGIIFRNHYEFNCKLSSTQWGNNSRNKLANRYITVGLGYRL
jgi:hypothetical protein